MENKTQEKKDIKTFISDGGLPNDEVSEEMTSIGKYLAYVIIVFAVSFMVLAFAKPDFLDKFMEWTKTVLFIVVGGGVAYITINEVVEVEKWASEKH